MNSLVSNLFSHYYSNRIYEVGKLSYIVLAIYSILFQMDYRASGARGDYASLLGLLDSFLGTSLVSITVGTTYKVFFILVSSLWALNIKIKIFSTLSNVMYWIALSVYVENIEQAESHAHQITLIGLALMNFATLANKLDKGAPKWLTTLLAFSAIQSYFHSAISKLRYTGLDWIEPANIQVIFSYFGQYDEIVSFVLNNPEVATFGAVVVLATELCAPLSLINNHLRRLLGTVYLLFNIIVWLVFEWLFLSHFITVLLYLVIVPDFCKIKREEQ